MPDNWNWDKEYPDICNEIRNVCEVGKCDQIKAFAFDIRVPVGFYRPAN
jgi:hypothetical protein